jgi:hypothetical protein
MWAEVIGASMLEHDTGWLAKYIGSKLDRLCAADDHTGEQLRKSFEHISQSERLRNLSSGQTGCGQQTHVITS